MFIIKICDLCGQDYMYHALESEFANICQECIELIERLQVGL